MECYLSKGVKAGLPACVRLPVELGLSKGVKNGLPACPLRKLNAALYKSCRKAGFSAAFLRFFFKAVEKARFYFRPAF